MKKILLLIGIVLLPFTYSYSQTTKEELFVTGIKNAKVYSFEQAEKGSEYIYSDGRTFKINFLFEQLDIFFYAADESKQRQQLATKFDVGYDNPKTEQRWIKKNVKFLVGQYDFDGDHIDELIIAIQDDSKGGMNNGITVDVFKLVNNQWILIGALTGESIADDKPMAEVYINTVTIQRHFRGFYWKWALESGKFKETNSPFLH